MKMVMDLSRIRTLTRGEKMAHTKQTARPGMGSLGSGGRRGALAVDLRVAGAAPVGHRMALPLQQDGLEDHCDGLGMLRPGGAEVVVGLQHAGVEGVETPGGDPVEVFAASALVWRTDVDGVHGRQGLLEDDLGVEEGLDDLYFALSVVGE